MDVKTLVGVAILAVVLAFVVAPAHMVSADAKDICISINGDTKVNTIDADVTFSDASCESVESDQGRPNIAIAFDGSYAQAGFESTDSGNRAVASGTDSLAGAGYGDNNTAVASGEGSYASAGYGDNNSATASGGGSRAVAGDGNRNTATASGDSSIALAALGDDNVALASGDDSFARATVGDDNAATATGACEATASGGDQTVTCTGP